MITDKALINFLSAYDEQVMTNAMKLRELLLKKLPGIIEEIDLPARMIGYSYGRKYTELICVIIPSKKGLKLGFNRGTELPDPDHLLEGTGKISRYVVIKEKPQISSVALKNLIGSALTAYKKRI